MKRMFVLASAVALVGLIGCGKKDEKKSGAKAGGGGDLNCETIVAKNKKCSAEIAEAFLGDMKLKPELKAKLKERMAKSFSSDRFKRKCERGWNSDKPRDKMMKETLTKCFAKSDCKEFAACFVSSMKKDRGMRRRRRGRRMHGPGDGHMHAPGDGHMHAPADMTAPADMK